jgi:fructose/tagatose bisphosphate aldolase
MAIVSAIGTAHGVYKTENPSIDFARFEKINKLVNDDGINMIF